MSVITQPLGGREVEIVEADTGLSTGGSLAISNVTVVTLEGQHRGSADA
jgi:hypothetical protein